MKTESHNSGNERYSRYLLVGALRGLLDIEPATHVRQA